MKAFFFFGYISLSLFAQNKETRVLEELISHKEVIIQSAHHFQLAPRVVASILYAERVLNYDYDDAILDKVLAQGGYNSSIGFGQIKLNTAFWIERELNNTQSKYILANIEKTVFNRSKSRNELIEKLINDSTNIYYCSAFLSMIKQRWGERFHFRTENEAGVLGTLYSLGIFRFDGTERIPHANPQMNILGKIAQEYFNSFKLRNVFQ